MAHFLEAFLDREELDQKEEAEGYVRANNVNHG